ncbi:hypothetical protein SAMN05443999_101342 [Roseovarius azorensis]|uniref:TFIIB zinc-binding n=2 Tax=Roseovarius azorensis TaxID=1287727 RepID=A0A1H7GQD9_9RHOB|nr:hypothetical protein SAMN05443999_101342 [Roseovarius azorensis]
MGMMTPKIATCCYCGTRAALVLDRGRHELACSRCGAPLHEMKTMPLRKDGSGATRPRTAPTLRRDSRPDSRQDRPRERRRNWGRRIWDEVLDAVEDIFD